MPDHGGAADIAHGKAKAPVGLPIGRHVMHPLHLAQGRGPQDFALPRPGKAEGPAGEFGEVCHAGAETCRRRDARRIEQLQFRTCAIRLQRAPAHSHLLAVEFRRNARTRIAEAERLEDVRGHIVRIGSAAHRFDRLADQRQAEVRILPGCRCRIERRLAADGRANLLLRGKGKIGPGPVGKVRFARKACRMGQRPAQGDRHAFTRIVGQPRPRQILRNRRIERDLALFPLLHQRDGSEQFGYRADRINRLGCSGLVLPAIGRAEPLRPHRPVAQSHSGGDRRNVAVSALSFDP